MLCTKMTVLSTVYTACQIIYKEKIETNKGKKKEGKNCIKDVILLSTVIY